MQVYDERPAAADETNGAVVEFKVRFGHLGYIRPGKIRSQTSILGR